MDVPSVGPFLPLHEILAEWPADRHLIFCDEALAADNHITPLAQLHSRPIAKAGLLIGPEGGFSDTTTASFSLDTVIGAVDGAANDSTEALSFD